ncbi:hypothetical protein [Streptomyces sp. NPDC059970]|uniref:hypothetical protein n=1 Tax=Streptomyces sp. NPDC059970 TaxID=3347019 RepID=UPI0036ACD269
MTAVRLRYKHILTDGGGIHEWRRQFLALCRGRHVDEICGAFSQPLDRRGPAGTRSASSPASVDLPDPSLQVPQSLVPLGQCTGVELTTALKLSGAVGLADGICQSAHVSRPSLMLFSLSWVLFHYSHQKKLLFCNIISPRRAVDSSIDCQMMSVQMLLTQPEKMSFGQALTAVQEATLRAYEEDTKRITPLRDIRALTLARRGIGGVSPVYFNFLAQPAPHRSTGSQYGPAAAPWDYADARVSTTIRRSTTLGDPLSPAIAVHLFGDDILIDITADAQMVPARKAEQFGPILLELWRVMARDLSAPTELAARMFPEGFCSHPRTPDLQGNWQHLTKLTSILSAAPGVLTAYTESVDGETVARLSLRPDVPFFDIHEHVLEQLPFHRDVAAPNRYLHLTNGHGAIDAGRATGAYEAGWCPSERLPQLPPSTPMEVAICAAITATHGHEVRNMAHTYAQADGQLLRAPAVVEELRKHRLIGLDASHFASPRTLRAMARALAHAENQEKVWPTRRSSSQ